MGFRSSLLDSCISDKINSAVSHATCQWNRQQLWFSCFIVYSQNTFKARRRNLRYYGENIWESHSETILITGQHLPKLCWKISSSSSWRISSAAADACSDDPRCPVRSSAALQDCLMPVSEALLIRCIQELRGRPGGLRHWASGRCPDLTSTACLSIWWTGVLASSLITWPNSPSRLFAMISLTFGKLMVAAMSDFFYMVVPFHTENLPLAAHVKGLQWMRSLYQQCPRFGSIYCLVFFLRHSVQLTATNSQSSHRHSEKG